MSSFIRVQEKATQLAPQLYDRCKEGLISNDRLKITDIHGSSFLLFEYHSKDPLCGYQDSEWIIPEILHAQPNSDDGIFVNQAIQFISFYNSLI